MDVIVYTVEARKRDETPYPASDFYTQDYDEARKYAEDNRLLLIENTYEWADSYLLEDYAPKHWAITYGGTTSGRGANVDDEPEIVNRFATEEEAREDLARLYAGDALYRVQNIPDEGEV